jgi:cytochrome c-type biogenesis protein
VRAYIAREGFAWPMLLDTSGEVTTTYHVSAIPTSFFLDGEGIIRAMRVGGLTRAMMEEMFEETLRQ